MLVSPPITKFTPPRPPSTLIDRSVLVERLETSGAPVTLVTGFAGAGKTVLLTTWMGAHPERAVAWLSCDSWDRDSERFWTSVVTALRGIDEQVGTDALDWMETDGDASVDVLASIINDLSALGRPTALVIDDLHAAPSSATRGLAEFLERLPANVRVVIGSRSDPVLPLHRWRVSHLLAELRDADLRLGVAEADAMLHAFGVDLDADDVERLTARTEGWAAGMQLAALSLRGREDAADFVR
jgi:LuxR family maltose regulon positive regulatory protein